MKLNILPSRTGYLWVKSGLALFFYKPASFLGFFASFMLVLMLLGSIPVIGAYLSLLAFPALTLGMMAVGNECVKIKNNMLLPGTPPPMWMAWMTIRRSLTSMLLLGLGFGMGFAIILLIGSAWDGGAFARFYLQGASITKDAAQNTGFQSAVLLTTVLYFPLAGVFWFAPALMNWKQMTLGKSLFFSTYAVFTNWRAFGIYLLVWTILFSVVGAVVLMLASALLGNQGAAVLLMPTLVMLSAMFMASIFPSFVDCFLHSPKQNDPANAN